MKSLIADWGSPDCILGFIVFMYFIDSGFNILHHGNFQHINFAIFFRLFGFPTLWLTSLRCQIHFYFIDFRSGLQVNTVLLFHSYWAFLHLGFMLWTFLAAFNWPSNLFISLGILYEMFVTINVELPFLPHSKACCSLCALISPDLLSISSISAF